MRSFPLHPVHLRSQLAGVAGEQPRGMPGTMQRYGHVTMYLGPPRVLAKLLAVALSEVKCLTKVRCRGVSPVSSSELMSAL
jgi:hypothetical protein